MGSAVILLWFFSLLAISAAGADQQPPVPSWPDKFSIQLKLSVEKYGPDWSSKGVLVYDWTTKTFRSDYIDWCLPLFDTGNKGNNNYTCSYLATEGSMYFVNHTSHAWQEYECCLLQQGLPPVPPDWMKVCQYNGTTIIEDTLCDSWWFPGTSDTNNSYFAYWNAKDDKKTPMRFFGFTDIGPAAIDYHDFSPGKIPDNMPLSLPNKECQQECKPPLRQALKSALQGSWVRKDFVGMPWPTCD